MTIEEKITLIAENEQRVYNAGVEKGKAEVGEGIYEEGFEAGKKSEYDAFWDAYQNYGNRASHAMAFAGAGWKKENFKPKYDIKPTNAQYMFRNSQINADLVEILENQGVVLDFSNVTNADRIFNDTQFTHIGIVDLSNGVAVNSTFACGSANNNLETIDKIILKDDGSNTFSAAFTNLNALKNITFEGVIGKSGFNLQWSKSLSRDSIVNIVSCLSTETSGLSITLSKNAVNKAFATNTGETNGSTSAEWLALIGTRSNWTISLV